MDHKWEVKYDPYNYNNGVPPEVGVVWQNGVWEWEDTMTVTAVPIPTLDNDIKECITSDICLICGKKNCPYIKNDKNYQALLEACRKGDSANARKIYLQRFSQYRAMFSGERNKGLQKDREAKQKGGDKSFQSKKSMALPGIWSNWTDLLGSTGRDAYTVNFDSVSETQSSFDVKIEYPTENGMKQIETMGPGSYFISDINGWGVTRISFKSHSVPLEIRIDYPRG